MGGWYNGRLQGHGASNEVWSSADGEKWEQVAKQAGWSPRIAAGAVVFKGRMWILGGTENYYFGDEKSLKNDVWSSADGKEWKQETAKAPWSARAYHAAVVHDGKIWVLAGGNYVPKYHALTMSGAPRMASTGNKSPKKRPGIRVCGSRQWCTGIECGCWAAGRIILPKTGAMSGIPRTARTGPSYNPK